MSKLSTALASVANAVKAALNALANTQKAKAKSFVHAKADDFYNSIDHVTETVTIAKFQDYVTGHIGGSGLGAVVVQQLSNLIAVGIASGLVDMGLKAGDALTRDELDKIVSYIDARIDGARF